MKRLKIWLLAVAGLLVALVLFAVRLPFQPPDGTRMILDQTRQVYIAPPCFDSANTTNNLKETTWGKIRKGDYPPESACSSDKLKSVPSTIWNKLMERSGFVENPWSW